jgi:transposase
MKKNRKQYTPEFKREVVALVIKQGHGYAEAARIVDINVSVLRRWEKEQRDHGSQAFPGQGHQLPELEEIARLKRELKRAHTEIEILKKATAYFARETL